MKVKLLHPNAIAPTKAYETDAGYDLYAAYYDILIPVHISDMPLVISTEIAVEIPDGKFGLIKERSSLASKGMIISGGVIDSGYIGPIKIICRNLSSKPIQFHKGDKIAQLIIMPIYMSEVQVVEELQESRRGKNGFGSSDATSSFRVSDIQEKL